MLKRIVLGLTIFVASCAGNTPLPNDCAAICTLIMGRAADWEVISDDLVRNIYRHNRVCEQVAKNRN